MILKVPLPFDLLPDRYSREVKLESTSVLFNILYLMIESVFKVKVCFITWCNLGSGICQTGLLGFICLYAVVDSRNDSSKF